MKTLNKKYLIFLGIGLICSFLLILLGGSSDTDKVSEKISDIQSYEERIEKRISEIIASFEGISDVKVMVIAESGVEYQYAQNTEENEGSVRRQYYSTSDRDALLLKEISPVISGVAVVCRGGDDIIVKQKVIELVGSMTGLPASRIYVGA